MKKGKLSGILALIVIVTVLLEVTQPQFRAIWPSVVALVPVLIGAVFSGAVFGDHCSPISDTTIVSSIASGVDPMDHVRTQMPYALIAAVGAAIIGFPISGPSNGRAAW